MGNKIPLDDEHWECFLLLLDILQLCTTKFASAGQAGFLEALIHDHHHLFLFDVILKLTSLQNAIYGAFSLPDYSVRYITGS